MTIPQGPVSTDAVARAVAAEVDRIRPGERGQLSVTLTPELAEVRAAWAVRPRLTVGGYAQRLWGQRSWRAAVRADWRW